VNIMLDEEDFKCLVRGGVICITGHGIKIALKDIGFEAMDEAITMADKGIDIYKNHDKEELLIFK
jgi:hypothetical protein